MRKINKTQVFASAVAVLLAATYYFEFYRVSVEEKEKEQTSKVIPFDADKIDQVRIENESGNVLLKRSADGWRMEEPVKDWADNTFADDFIGGLTSEKAIEVAAEGASIDWSVFGLSTKPAKITFTNQQGQSSTLSVSDKKNFEGNSFLRRDQENKVLVVSSQWLLRAKGTAIDFRDKRFFRGKISAVDTIHIRSSKEDFKLVRKEGESSWIAERDPKLAIDQNRVREILTSLNETRASDYIEALPKDAAFRSKVDLKMGDKEWSGELLQSADKTIYAKTSDPAFTMKMTPGQSDKLFDMTLNSLRNRREAFDFRSLTVKRIEIKTDLKKTVLVKSGETWTVEGNASVKLDPDSVKNFIVRLSESAISEFLLPAEQKSFKDPSSLMVLKDDKQALVFQLAWGPTIKKKIPTGQKELILAQSNLYAEPFGLDPSVIESWGIHSLFPTTSPKEAPTTKEAP